MDQTRPEAGVEELEGAAPETAPAEVEDVPPVEVEESAEERAERLQLQLVQLAADFENYKRQAARREAEAKERAARRLLEDLLPIFDNFDRAIQAANSARDVETMRIGLDFIGQQMTTTLGDIGIQTIEPTGEMFDPAQHDAIEEVPGSGEPAGTVLETASRGYILNNTVLRAARVKVAG
jgi:molecular chaperone GrpE